MRWAYCVTSVKSRVDNLLKTTLVSLHKAGFTDPDLFVDDCDDPKEVRNYLSSCSELFSKIRVTARYPTLRTYGNWILSLAELYIRNPGAERYAVFQDDFVTCLNLRSYLNRCEYPTKGYLNLYTFPSNEPSNLEAHGLPSPPKGHQGWYRSNQNGRGAVALVFNREAVTILLSSQHMVERPMDIHRGWRAVDGGIVESMRKAGWEEFVHTPSLTQHQGKVSSMHSKPHRQALTFPGENFDCLSLIKGDGSVSKEMWPKK